MEDQTPEESDLCPARGACWGGGMLPCLRGGDEKVSRTVGALKCEREDILEWIVTGRQAQRQEAHAT